VEVYQFLGESPPLGLPVQRHGDELRLVTTPEMTASVERHLNVERPVALSKASLEVLAIIPYRQPVASSAIELIRRIASDSATPTLLQPWACTENIAVTATASRSPSPRRLNSRSLARRARSTAPRAPMTSVR
jgi:hypothetical protein